MTDINLTGTISAASLSGRLSNLYIPKDVTEYDGPTSITPSTIQQQFETARKLVNENLVVEGAKLDVLEAMENGTYRPDGDAVGFSRVDVYVNPDLRPLSVSENGSYQPDGFDGYSDVTVDVQGMDAVLFAKGDYPLGDVRFPDDITEVSTRLSGQKGITSIDFNNVKSVKYNSSFEGCTEIETFRALELLTLSNSMFQDCTSLYAGQMMDLSVIAPKCQTIDSRCFQGCNMSEIRLPQTLKKTNTYAINRNSNLTKVYFTGKPAGISLGGATFDMLNNLGDIYVPWSEGEVANAPWGANNATIHYDTVYDEDGNVISST